MTARKPVLLRRAPMSGGVMALTSYNFKKNGAVLEATPKGKHDVTADFDALLLETLVPNQESDIIYWLSAAANGAEITTEGELELNELLTNLEKIMKRFNEEGHGSDSE